MTKCELDEITSLYFNMKKVGTRVMVQKEPGEWHPIIEKKVNFTITVEAGSDY